MRRHIRKAISLASIAALLAPIGLTAVNANDVKNAESNPIKDCLSKMTNPRLAVQFLIDESKSLQDSDPSDQRVDAIKRNADISQITRSDNVFVTMFCKQLANCLLVSIWFSLFCQSISNKS